LAAWAAAAGPGDRAGEILKTAGVTGGLVVHAGCGEGRLTAALRAHDGLLVHGLEADETKLAAAREHIRSQGLYGPVSADRWDGHHLPYADNTVNLIVAEAAVEQDEAMRVLAPEGVLLAREGETWKRTLKPRPGDIDEWTHYFHDAGGNPVARDERVGPPRRLQWVAGPPWARHHDHMASMTSLVSTGGRLFYIFDEGPTASIQLPSQWRLIARDAFNGTLLWKRQMDSWNTRQWPLKSGPAHLVRRLVAVGDRVYTTLDLEAPVTALDAPTGKTVLTYAGSEHTREILVCDDVLLAVADSTQSRLTEWRRKHTYVWANSNDANRLWAWSPQPRRVLAYEAKSGKALWQAEHPVAPCSMAAEGDRVVFYDGEKLVCLRRADGKVRWQSEPAKAAVPVHTSTGPRVLIYRDVVLFAGNNGRMSAWAAGDGKKLWEAAHYPSGHQSLKDLMVVGDLVWTAHIAASTDNGVFTAYDIRTGKVKNEFLPDVKLYWFHHRCYPSKATEKYLLTSRTGVEYVDPSAKHWETHHWVRGGCIYGVLPCNGLTYAPMHSCGCYLESKLNGFNALAAGPAAPESLPPVPEDQRLQRGPAYAQTGKQDGPAPSPGPAGPGLEGATDWPTYRHDIARSGAAGVSVPAELRQAWAARIGGRLTQSVVAGGRVFVSAVDAHTLHALDAASGKPLWRRTLGGRVDSPPTVWAGLVIAGCTDGSVYALRAGDGEPVWRFLAAPADRRIVSYDQLESSWPVHGSVLVKDGVVYCTAGRSIFLDGGIHLLRLDAATGRLIGRTVFGENDPETGKNMQTHVDRLNMPVALSDVLSCDGQFLYMRSQKIDLEGRRLEIPVEGVDQQPAEGSHLFCQIGFLDDTWFHRSFWTFGRRVTGGYGGWYQAGRMVPAGRILAFDDKQVFGYGRKPQYYTNASVLEYQLFAAEKSVTSDAIRRVRSAKVPGTTARRNTESSDWKPREGMPVDLLTAAHYQWVLDQPSIQVRAMLAARDSVVVAGHPDYIDERRALRLPDEAEVQAALDKQADALAGKHGGLLWVVAKADGKPAARYRLPAPPIHDGLSAAGGQLFISCTDGTLLCLSGQGRTPLSPQDSTEPLQVISDEPKTAPPQPVPVRPRTKEQNLNGEFAAVTGGVFKCDLGYRLRPKAQKTSALAMKKLDQPVTSQATFRTKVRVGENEGMLQNGYLVLGDAGQPASLLYCGLRYKLQQAHVAQGGMATKGAGNIASGEAPLEIDKTIDLAVTVDLGAQEVTFTAAGATVKAKLAKPMKAITHAGFATTDSVADFAPIDVAGGK